MLVAFIYYVGVNTVVRILLSVSPLVVLFMVMLQLCSFVFYASAWYILIRAAGYKMPFVTCQGISFASIFMSYTTPSGIFLEATRCILGSRETGMKLGEATATVILHRILYIIGFLATTALALLALLSVGSMPFATLLELAVIPVSAVAGLIILLYLSFDPKKIQPLLDRFLKFAQPIVRLIQKEATTEGKASQFLQEYQMSFRKMLTSKRQMFLSLLASVGDWGCSVAILWIVLIAMGTNASIWVVMITMAIGKMIQMTPIAVPGMIGIYEAAITTTLVLLSIPVSIAVSAALLSRIVTFWLELPVTGIAAYHYGFKLVTRSSGSILTA